MPSVGELALLHPAYGCNKIEALLALEGRRVLAITVQKILNDKGLGTRHERWVALERQHADQVIEPSPGQARFLEKLNPCFKERHVESGRPGQLLSQDTFMVGALKGIGRIYLHAPCGAAGSPQPRSGSTPTAYAFGFLHVPRQPEAAVAVVHNDVLPFYERLGLALVGRGAGGMVGADGMAWPCLVRGCGGWWISRGRRRRAGRCGGGAGWGMRRRCGWRWSMAGQG